MSNDDFEKQLRAAAFKAVPAEWREQILQSSRAGRQTVRVAAVKQAGSSGFSWWTSWLWPRPAAWGALGGIWLCIFGLNLAQRSSDQQMAPALSSSDSRSNTPLHEQRALLSQLLESEPSASGPADSHKPRRRSERPADELSA